MIKQKINGLVKQIRNQRTLFENYFYLTLVQLMNTVFYFIIYPFSIKIFGAHEYGLFLFSTTIISYITLLISFGIDLPALKILAQNIDNVKKKSDLLSDVFSTKLILSIVSIIVLLLVIVFYSSLTKLLLINSLQAFASVFLLNWYYQGLQKMRWYVLFQIGIRLISIVMLFLVISNKQDLVLYSFIISGSVFLSAVATFCYLVFKERLKVSFVKFSRIRDFLKYSYHFFLNSSISVIRAQSTTLLIGSFVGMREVTYFDLATKVILLPQSIVSNINNALFPKILKSEKIDRRLVKKIFLYEFFIGLLFICSVILFGRWVIGLFLHENIELTHYLTIIMSITIMSWLLVGCTVNFVFISTNRYDLISKNQLLAFISFFLFCFAGFLISRTVYIVAIGIAFSALCEMIFCVFMVMKLKFFKENRT